MYDSLLSSAWNRKKLEHVAEVIDSLHKTPSYAESGHPMVRVTDIKGGYLDLSNCRKVSEEVFQEFTKKYLPKRGDIVLSRVGTYGISSYVNTDQHFCLGQNTVVIQPKLNSRYLYFCLNSPSVKQQIEELVGGSTQKTISLKSIRSLEIPVPSDQEIEKIAHILGTLDDKIELNQQMNRTLEGIARALFKSWFIDFDPVRAKLDGRQPFGMDAETAALFPDAFEDSAIGPIPKGWRVSRLDDLVVLQRGFDLPTRNRTLGKYPILAASGPSGTHCEFKVKGPGVTTGRSGVLGNVFFVHEDFWPLNTSLWVKEFRDSRPIHAYHLLRNLNFELFNAGSAVPTLNRNHVHNLPIINAPLTVVEKFEEVATPIFAQCKANEEQNKSIATTRDALLPKLLSGEIRIKEAEQAVEAVA